MCSAGDPSLTSALTNRYNGSSLVQHQAAIYDANTIPTSGSPVQQVYTTACKPEPAYWHQAADYNVNSVIEHHISQQQILFSYDWTNDGRCLDDKQGFSQAIVLENPGIPTGDYVTNGGAWQFQLPETYDPMSGGGPECVNCSTSQSAYWRRAEGGHSLCHTCSFSRQSRVSKIPKNKAPVVSSSISRMASKLCSPILMHPLLSVFRQRVIDGRALFVPIVRRARPRCGDGTIKANQCVTLAVSTINYTMSIDRKA